MGTCGQPGYVFRDFCLEKGTEFIIWNKDKITRICMELLKHERANILPPYCNNMLIFGNRPFFIMFFQNISVNPIIS